MFGIMDKDISAEMLLGVPELYKTGQGEGVSDTPKKSCKRSVLNKNVQNALISFCLHEFQLLCCLFRITGLQLSGFPSLMPSIRVWSASLFHIL